MVRHRRSSTTSTASMPSSVREQELSSMYDYLAKVILLGPSGCGKSCLLHRFVKDEWRVLSSQTIGVEFASRIVKVGTGSRRKRIKLQLWDTAGTERFRSVSRSYYRGAAGAILVYDISSHSSFRALPTFLNDARALASPHLTLVLAGNKSDVTAGQSPYLGANGAASTLIDAPIPESPLASSSSPNPIEQAQQNPPAKRATLGSKQTATLAPEGRDVAPGEASTWAASQGIKAVVEVSALTGAGVEELFTRLAKMILTRIELGEIDPDDPQSGIQYGDAWDERDRNGVGSVDAREGSVRSGFGLGNLGLGFGSSTRRSRRATGVREWEEVFRVRGKRSGCC